MREVFTYYQCIIFVVNTSLVVILFRFYCDSHVFLELGKADMKLLENLCILSVFIHIFSHCIGHAIQSAIQLHMRPLFQLRYKSMYAISAWLSSVEIHSTSIAITHLTSEEDQEVPFDLRLPQRSLLIIFSIICHPHQVLTSLIY